MNYEQNAAKAFGSVIQNTENTPPDDSFDPADEFNEEGDMPVFTKDDRTGELTPEEPETPVNNPSNMGIPQDAQNASLHAEKQSDEQSLKSENKIAEIVNDEPVISEEVQEIDKTLSEEDSPVNAENENQDSAPDKVLFGGLYSHVDADHEDREPANKKNTKAETVNRSGVPIETNPSSPHHGRPAPLGSADEFGITEFMQTLDAMCGRFTDKSGEEDRCMESCPLYSENVEGNCVVQQFPRTDALLSWCAAVLQKYMTEETQQKSRRIDVMKRMIPGFKEEYLSEEGKCTALDHFERKEPEKAWTWLDLLKTALPDFDEKELSDEGLKALKQTTQW